MIGRLANRYGYRGLWLIVMGATWCVFGLGALVAPELPARSWVLIDMVPDEVRSAGWILTGAVAVWQGHRGPSIDDSKGHVALYVMPAVQVISFAMSAVIYTGTAGLAKLGELDQVSGWSGAWYATLVWSFVSLMLALAAAWPNPKPPLPCPPSAEEIGP